MFKLQNFLKRYVWDPETTPYFVKVSDLSRSQADNELFFFALMAAIFLQGSILALHRLSTSSATSMSGLSGHFDVAPMTKLNPLLIAARDGCRERLQGLLQP